MTPSPKRPTAPRRIVVVGGGFSGSMSAVDTARQSELPLHVTVVDDQGPVGRGVAYRLRRPEYLLNVAALNVAAYPGRVAQTRLGGAGTNEGGGQLQLEYMI